MVHRKMAPQSLLFQARGYLRHDPSRQVGLSHPWRLRESRLTEVSNYSLVFVVFLRRIGPDPHAQGAATPSLNGCPDILEMDSGDIALIGIDITDEAKKHLRFGASCGPDEKIVRIPRKVILAAKADLRALS